MSRVLLAALERQEFKVVRSFSSKVFAAAAGAAMLAMTLAAPAPASAFTLAAPDLGHSFASEGQVQKAWWYRYGYHPYRWGYGYHPYRWGYYHPYYRWHRCWHCW